MRIAANLNCTTRKTGNICIIEGMKFAMTEGHAEAIESLLAHAGLDLVSQSHSLHAIASYTHCGVLPPLGKCH